MELLALEALRGRDVPELLHQQLQPQEEGGEGQRLARTGEPQQLARTGEPQPVGSISTK